MPLGTASALEFLGPLGVAVARGQGATKLWPAIAAVGIVLLTEPWHGTADPIGVAFALAAAVCWAAYILLTQRVGDEVKGLNGLAISMPVAGLISIAVAGPSLQSELTPRSSLMGLGLAVLLPVIPFALEMLALRRLTTTAFGTLMSLEPAIALVVGLFVLSQTPGLVPAVGLLFVVAAGVGAERTGARDYVTRSAKSATRADRLVLVGLVEHLVARAVDHASSLSGAREALDDRAGERDRHELVVAAVDVEQRQRRRSPGPAAIASSAAMNASSVGRFQPPW